MESHDQNFKNLILGYPREALEFFAASEAKSIPMDAEITPVRQELLKERLGDRFFETDVPLEVKWPNGERETIVFCIEENSKGYMADLRRHAVYCLLLSELLETTRVVPVAIHPFDRMLPEERFELTGDFGTYLEFKVLTTALPHIDAAQHFESKNRVELICLPLMKYDSDQRQEIVFRSIEGLIANESNVEKRIKFGEFVAYYARLEPKEFRDLRSYIDRRSAHKDEFMSLLDLLHAEGEAKGKVEGKVEIIETLCRNGIITGPQAREQLQKLAAAGEIPPEKLREAFAKLPQK